MEEEELPLEERIYTVPLGKVKYTPRKKRAPKAIKILREFIHRHMKIEPEKILIDPDVNHKIWERGIEKPPNKLRIRAVKDKDEFEEEFVEIFLAEG